MSSDAIGESEWLILSQSLIGGRTARFPLVSARGIAAYPLDTYTSSWTGLIEDGVSADRVPVLQSVEPSVVPGFDLAVTRVPTDAAESKPVHYNPMGRFSYALAIQRDPATRFQVGLLAATMVLGGVASFIMTALIVSRRRPPSLAALGWLATFLFALLEVRRNFPGSPPAGVRLDAFVTFPMISIIIVLFVVNAIVWLRRDDWDMTNQPALEEPKPASGTP